MQCISHFRWNSNKQKYNFFSRGIFTLGFTPWPTSLLSISKREKAAAAVKQWDLPQSYEKCILYAFVGLDYMKAIEKVLASNERKVRCLTTREPSRCGENEPDMVVVVFWLKYRLAIYIKWLTFSKMSFHWINSMLPPTDPRDVGSQMKFMVSNVAGE